MKFAKHIAAVNFTLFVVSTLHAQLAVVSLDPPRHSMTAPATATISVTFNDPVNPVTLNGNNFRVFARWSGSATGTFGLSNGGQTVTFTPARPFSHGEIVTVTLSHDLQGADGMPLRAAGYSYQFWTATLPSTMDFQELDVLTTNEPGTGDSSQPYGGIGSDLDQDGWLDMAIVNEVTGDLRVFMNNGDGTGMFSDFLVPTFPIGSFASPSEPADFDNDGFVDICVANQGSASVSVLLGNGDGSFGPQQVIAVGGNPRGIAVLDIDGDGDTDIVNTNASAGNLSRHFNTGNGVFAAPTTFDGGISGERALAAADMNEDGILDLVIGSQTGQVVAINTGNGNGTFSFTSQRSAGGGVWMLVTGDLNGDGHIDVATANSSANNGAILFGTGTGTLNPAVTYPTDPFAIATDLGDLDGDGDLDWVTSSYSGDWFVYENNGVGTFTFRDEFVSPIASSCSIPMDMDNDGDLDLALVDEEADVVILMKNSGTTPMPAVGVLGGATILWLILTASVVLFRKPRVRPLG